MTNYQRGDMPDFIPDDRAEISVMRLMERLDPDNHHALQVAFLAVRLYDELFTLHGLGHAERRLLRFSALLHDIGWSTLSLPHHKGSMNLILADNTIPLSHEERMVVALTARYHRKSPPLPGHPHFHSLSPELQRTVRWNAGLLRVADALDRPHQSYIRDISAHIYPLVIGIRCNAPDPRSLNAEECMNTTLVPLLNFSADISGNEKEKRFSCKKSDLLSELSGRRIEIIWN